MNNSVHVFAGMFGTCDAAILYSEPQWEPEPGGEVTDEEYDAWEKRNPSWQMRKDLGVCLDSDFIETIMGSDLYDYLGELLANKDNLQTVRERAGEESDTLILVFSEALGGFPVTMHSTARLRYCGEFACRL